MALSKSSEFDREKKRFSELTKALSHPARLAILEILADRKECMCGHISEKLPLAQSTVSQHLKALKEAGLIKGTISGASICYDVNPEVLRECCELFDRFCEKMMSKDKVQIGEVSKDCKS